MTRSHEKYNYFHLSYRSLGITLYSFVFGDIPWRNCNSIPVLYEQIKSNEITFPTSGIKISDDLKELIMAMLIKDPEKRISMEQIKVKIDNFNLNFKLIKHIMSRNINGSQKMECILCLVRINVNVL